MLVNLHTHTRRCRHAAKEPDRAWVEAALAAGVRTLGFSDHCPWPRDAPPVPPPATTTSYDARTGSEGDNGAASPMRPRRSAALPAARPTATAAIPFSAHGPTAKMPSGNEVNVSGVA